MSETMRPQPRVSTTDLNSGCFSASGGTPSWNSATSPSPIPCTGGNTPPLPTPKDIIPRTLTERESQLVKHLSRLQFFLATAPTRWMGTDEGAGPGNSPFESTPVSSPHPNLNRFLLPNGERVACVFWNGLYHITGTDIVRALVFRFEAFSRPVRNIKKFEEGVFSDLRNLKPGTDACLEEPKSPFLDLLFRNGCIRTQKKQKVFYWFSVPHDRLFLDALERDLKREKMGLEPTTVVIGEPARSFRYDPKRSLFEQFAGKEPGLDDPTSYGRIVDEDNGVFLCADDSSRARIPPQEPLHTDVGDLTTPKTEMMDANGSSFDSTDDQASIVSLESDIAAHVEGEPSPAASAVLFSRSLFEGSPAYKQGRKRIMRDKRNSGARGSTTGSVYDIGDDSGSDSEGLPLSDYSYPTPHDTNLANAQGGHEAVPSMDRSLTGHSLPPFQRESPLENMAASTTPIPNSSSLAPTCQQQGHLDWTSLKQDPSRSLANQNSISDANSSNAVAATVTAIPSSTNPGKGFACPLLSCGRVFKRLEHLKRHVRTHTQERPFECRRCSKRFSRSDNLTQHIKTHEKAGRGARMKTEASESTESDHNPFLDGDMEMPGSRDLRSLSVIDNYPYHSMDAQRFPPGRLSYMQHVTSATHDNPGAVVLGGQVTHRGSPHPRDWTGLRAFGSDQFQQGSGGYKRHRSMTPNVPPSGRTSLGHFSTAVHGSPAPSERYHPYAAVSHFQRASSLDSNTFRDPAAGISPQTIRAGHMLANNSVDVNYLGNPMDPPFPMGSASSGPSVVMTMDSSLPHIGHDGSGGMHGLKEGANGDEIATNRAEDWKDNA